MNEIYHAAVLAYHEVNSYNIRKMTMRRMEPSCLINDKVFEKHIDIINSYKLSTLCSYEEINQKYKNKKIIITFDDGHVGNYEFALPVLMKYNLKAIFFITTSLIDTQDMMNWKQIKEISEKGMAIQSHCVNHVPLATLSKEKMKQELVVSKDIIEQITGKEVFSISLPNGSMHKDIINEARNAGYKYIFTSKIAYFDLESNDNVILIPRIPIPDNLSIETFKNIILQQTDIVNKWAKKQKIKFIIRDFIGINNYRRVYRIFHKIHID